METVFGLLRAFCVGGAFCLVGQLLLDYTRLTPARILVGFVVAGVLLGALGVYAPLADFAGSGAKVPLTGFGFALAEGTREAVERDGLSGVLTGALSAASGGVTAAVLCGLLASFLTRPKKK